MSPVPLCFMFLGYHSIDDAWSHVFLRLSLHQIQCCDGQNLSALCGHCAAGRWMVSQVISTRGPIAWRWAISLLRCVVLMSESSRDTWLAVAVWPRQWGPKRCVRLNFCGDSCHWLCPWPPQVSQEKRMGNSLMLNLLWMQLYISCGVRVKSWLLGSCNMYNYNMVASIVSPLHMTSIDLYADF